MLSQAKTHEMPSRLAASCCCGDSVVLVLQPFLAPGILGMRGYEV